MGRASLAFRDAGKVSGLGTSLGTALLGADVCRLIWPKEERIPFDWASIIRWRVHSVQVFIIEALSWVRRPLSATELQELCGRAATLDAVSFHLNQLAKLALVERVARLKVRKSQGLKRENFFFFVNDPSWIDRIDQTDKSDPLAAVVAERIN